MRERKPNSEQDKETERWVGVEALTNNLPDGRGKGRRHQV